MAERLEITTVDDDRWRRLVDSSDQSTPFHHPAWATLLADCYRYRTFVAAIVDDGTMVAGAPVIEVDHRLGRRRWLCLPFSDACAPIAVDDRALRSLVSGLDEARASAGVAQVEVRSPLPQPARPLPREAAIHRRPLPPTLDELRRTIQGSHRRNISLAARRGVVVRRAESRTDLSRVYFDLHVATRHRHGVPAQPRRYFELLWDRLMAPELGTLLLAYAEGRPIAGSVFLRSGRTLVHKYSASDPAAWRLRANDLLMWEGLAWGVESGCQRADFGRTDADNAGLRAFKAAWGGQEEPLMYSTLGTAARDGRGHAVRLSRPILRRGPLWLNRVSGQVLYRYAA
jgi:CelD/BcsL family acetyltransferase involved in cellulose biosynthesis